MNVKDLKPFDLIEIKTKNVKLIEIVDLYENNTLHCYSLKGMSSTYVNCKYPIKLIGNIEKSIKEIIYFHACRNK